MKKKTMLRMISIVKLNCGGGDNCRGCFRHEINDVNNVLGDYIFCESVNESTLYIGNVGTKRNWSDDA